MSVKIGVIQMPRVATGCSFDPNCPRRGYGIDVANMACEYLKLNCTFVPYAGGYGNVSDNGTSSGLIGAIQDGEFDLSLPIISPSYARSQAVAFSHIYLYMDVALVTRDPKMENVDKFNWSIVYAYQWPVILTLIASLVAISLVITFGSSRESQSKKTVQLMDNCSSLLTKRYQPFILELTALRVTIGIWGLVSVVLLRAYTGMLFMQKVSSNVELPFTDLESFAACLEKKRCQMVMPGVFSPDENPRMSILHDLDNLPPTASISYFLQITSASSKLTTRIRQAIKNDGLIILPQEDIPQAIRNITDGYLVWLWSKEGANNQIGGDRNCEFYTVDVPFQDTGAFAVRKNSSLSKSLDQMALSLRETGLADKAFKKYGRPVLCTDQMKNVRKSWTDFHGLYSVRTAFYFYIAGNAAGIVAWIAEIARGSTRRHASVGMHIDLYAIHETMI